jgi:hypothetical protein
MTPAERAHPVGAVRLRLVIPWNNKTQPGQAGTIKVSKS